jgi:8-oxo-dGTP pyrophosphatase MutT (NUDIX family)
MPAAVKNAYGDLQVVGPLPADPSAFTRFLSDLFARPDCDRGVWLELPWALAPTHSGPAVAAGFRVHHASGGALTLQAWRSAKRNPTPPFAHTAIGAGAIVVNGRGEVLGIRERFDQIGLLFPPGGHVDEGEDWLEAATREAWEETGVRCEAIGVLAARELQIRPQSSSSSSSSSTSLPSQQQSLASADPDDADAVARAARAAQSLRFGSTHLAVHVLCAAADDDDAPLRPDPEEIADARWHTVDDFVARAHPHIAVMVRAAADCGQIEAAAAHARAMRAKAKAGGSGPGPYGAAEGPLQSLIHTHVATLRKPAGPPGASAPSATPSASTSPVADHVFYHALPPAAFARAAAGLPATVKGVGKGASARGTAAPAAAAAAAAAVVGGGRGGGLLSVRVVGAIAAAFVVGVIVGSRRGGERSG